MSQIYATDIAIGDEFRASNYGLVVGFVNNYEGNDREETGISVETVEEYIGELPTPIYISQKYSSKLKMELSLVKDPCKYPDPEITEFEIRGILRQVFGRRGYQWMGLINDNIGDDISYKVRVINVDYQRINSKVVGLILGMECDSQFGYSPEQKININVLANTPFYIYTTSDDLNNYLYPDVIITCQSAGNLIITNNSDNEWVTRINNCGNNEILEINNQKEIITSSNPRPFILNDFNLHWLRLLPDKNEFICSMDANIVFKFRNPRRVGFVNI